MCLNHCKHRQSLLRHDCLSGVSQPSSAFCGCPAALLRQGSRLLSAWHTAGPGSYSVPADRRHKRCQLGAKVLCASVRTPHRALRDTQRGALSLSWVRSLHRSTEVQKCLSRVRGRAWHTASAERQGPGLCVAAAHGRQATNPSCGRQISVAAMGPLGRAGPGGLSLPGRRSPAPRALRGHSADTRAPGCGPAQPGLCPADRVLPDESREARQGQTHSLLRL